MARRIKFRAQCYKCLRWFEAGKAFLQRTPEGWKCHCDECYKRKSNENGGGE